MSNKPIIKVENLTKIYKLYDAPIDRLKEALHWRHKKYHKDFYALNNISFEINTGECVGIIGKNGSGKSTLLKIIAKVLTPSSGAVTVNGKVSALLELGAGFNPEYTGIENIYFQGSLMGYTKEEIDKKVDAILSFADIGEFAFQPVKMYSSGMFARLAFAVAINVEPDILIVDEALSVGDMFFQAKSMAKMKSLIEDKKVTVLFVTHDISSIKAMCNKAILLENGCLQAFSEASIVTDKYFKTRFEHENIIKESIDNDYNNEDFLRISNFQRIQNNKASFSNVVLLDDNNKVIKSVYLGQSVTLRCYVSVHENIHNLAFGYHIRSINGVDLLYNDSILQKYNLHNVSSGMEFVIDWHFKINLQNGMYNIATVLSIPINLEVAEVDMCDFIPIAFQFEVHDLAKVYSYILADSSLKVTIK